MRLDGGVAFLVTKNQQEKSKDVHVINQKPMKVKFR